VIDVSCVDVAFEIMLGDVAMLVVGRACNLLGVEPFLRGDSWLGLCVVGVAFGEDVLRDLRVGAGDRSVAEELGAGVVELLQFADPSAERGSESGGLGCFGVQPLPLGRVCGDVGFGRA